MNPRPARTEDASPASQPVRVSGKDVPDADCGLVGIDAGTLYVRSERRIADASPVTVSFDHTRLSGYVAGCQPVEDEWVVAIELTSGRRREARIPTGEQYTVGIVGNKGTTPCQCTVIDKSASGLGLRLSRSVAPGTRIYVEMESMMALGEIRHCRETQDGGFVAGMAVAEFLPDMGSRGKLAGVMDKLRWKVASGLRGKNIPAYRPGR